MKKLLLFYRLAIAIPMVGLIGCNPKADNITTTEPEIPVVSTYFDYKTTNEFVLQLNLSSTSGPIGITRFDVYTQNPIVTTEGIESLDKSLDPVFTGFTDERGVFSDRIVLPSYVSDIYIYTEKPGIKRLRTHSLNSNTIVMDESKDVVSAFVTRATTYNTISASLKNVYTYMSWDASGRPNNITSTDVIPAALLQDIATSLPEQVVLTTSHPEYIKQDAITELTIIDSCTIDVSFVSEGAGYLNVLGYYLYKTGSAPAKGSGVDNMRKYVVFPNTSFVGSGGNLNAGNRVRLKYWNGSKYVDGFPKGYTVGWFLIANGFSNTVVTPGLYTHFSHPTWNNETDVTKQQHVVELYDQTRNLVVLSFEDIRRDQGGCDNDFNDAIFYAIPTPIEAVITDAMSTIDRFSDRDNDGVSDTDDEFPDDPTLAKRVYYPAKGVFGTLAYEDLWPSVGDYDMNDLVCDYNFIHYVNATNKVVRSEGVIRARAAGAKYLNGFGIQLGVPSSSVQSVTVTGGSLTHGVISIDNATGLESGQTLANIILFDNIYQEILGASSGGFINTDMTQAKIASKDIAVKIVFKQPQTLSALTLPPYNPYAIADCGNGSRGREVHLPTYKPTDKATIGLFSTGQDLTNPALSRYFVAANNLPFAINIPVSFTYPTEKSSIQDTYLKFTQWAASNGTQFKDWYLNNNGYRNSSLLYSK